MADKKVWGRALRDGSGLWSDEIEFGVTPSGLGYENWLATERYLRASHVDLRGDFVASIHPFIRASETHAEALGVPVGSSIAGIRWVERAGGRPARIDDATETAKGEK